MAYGRKYGMVIRIARFQIIAERAACPLEFIEGDLRDLDSVRKAVDCVDYVLHQGALPSVQRSINDPITINEVNVNGTLNVLIAARDAGVKRVVYASSSSISDDESLLPTMS